MYLKNFGVVTNGKVYISFVFELFMVKTRTFELKSVVIKPSVPLLVLEGPDMPEVLRAIDGVIDSKYGGNDVLRVLKLEEVDGVNRLVGSSSLILPVVCEVFPQYRAIKPEEVERTLRECDPLEIADKHYVDYGAVLDFSGNNHKLAVEVFRRLPRELREIDRLPAMMLGYGLQNSDEGDYGVAPVYLEGTELRTAKILSQPFGKFNESDDGLVSSGLPLRLGEGKRTLYTAIQGEPSEDSLGISRFYLNGCRDLGSGGDGLSGSNSDGWVVFVAREAAPSGKKA